MYFILALLAMLLGTLAMIVYVALKETIIPLFMETNHGAKFRKRVSWAVYRLMIDTKNDFWGHLVTICEGDGDEPFEPYVDSPLRTCPPTEFITSPPKEEVDINSNVPNGFFVRPGPVARRGRGRGRQRVVLPAAVINDPPPRRLPQPANGLGNRGDPAVVIPQLDLDGLRQQLDARFREIGNIGIELQSPPAQNDNENEQAFF